ncbi:hypothetical protein Ga0100231_018900 [Opitutaceae bacterium TAV4]|nr:hypothetical protein Ga0100231_018900 [Opitutaceae bacterium TAV4]RRK00166.1 hypothetical protein Ga0100230_019565 [Opitutaceae bacterium TAV3]
MEIRLHSSLAVGVALLALALAGSSETGARPIPSDPSKPASPAKRPQVIKQFPLDERTVYEIPIGRDVPTTLMFPSALTAIEAANISTHPETPAPVLLAYTPGRYFFSVRALEPNAKAAVNVIWKNRTFVLRFVTSEEPYGSVTFYEDALAGRSASFKKRVTPETLLGLLDRAKSFRLVAQQYPEAVQQIEHAAPGDVTLYKDFRVTVEEVFRFDPEDTLVFKLRLKNAGEKEVIYQPQRLAVRVGQHVYHASIADASGIIPPKAEATGYFAITGTPNGGRANLSIKNRFSVIVPRVERDARLVLPE